MSKSVSIASAKIDCECSVKSKKVINVNGIERAIESPFLRH